MATVRQGAYEFKHGASQPHPFADIKAGIRLEVELADDVTAGAYRIRTAEVDPSSEPTTPEHAAAAFGIAYAIECLPAEFRRSVRAVTIQRIWWHPLHARTAALAYAAAMALWKSFGGSVPNPPPFSEQGMRFVFPMVPGGTPAEPVAAADGGGR
jgi:hypothetical protein